MGSGFAPLVIISSSAAKMVSASASGASFRVVARRCIKVISVFIASSCAAKAVSSKFGLWTNPAPLRRVIDPSRRRNRAGAARIRLVVLVVIIDRQINLARVERTDKPLRIIQGPSPAPDSIGPALQLPPVATDAPNQARPHCRYQSHGHRWPPARRSGRSRQSACADRIAIVRSSGGHVSGAWGQGFVKPDPNPRGIDVFDNASR